uniref:Mitochondrial carrier protein n=1 Tax=Phaeomonas parva TaxID=124430 RepID=A0A6U4GJ12_9STRA|mmetsp:Transcript_30195/g.96329  ORF Transcript_30195/g.96329 Transcript_30195/m.96329 type:complete len:321 (+) Transcript_30195:385-1347(+)
MASADKQTTRKRKPFAQHLVCGGAAGLVESFCCHPLDTIKTRMQLRVLTAGRARKGPLLTGVGIVQREGFFSLYKGLTAVVTGIVPKMAVRFSSYEQYRIMLDAEGDGAPRARVFLAGLGSGVTEAILVVTPAEVCKIRMQSQYHSLKDPALRFEEVKYRNVFQTAYTIVREEGLGALYKGVGPTIARQGCNQAVNFTAYQSMKDWVSANFRDGGELASWQHLLLGGLSGGMGPLANNPLDVVKTRMQKQVILPGETPKYAGMISGIGVIAREEGVGALWRGITPRLMRIMPGQAITFMTYEFMQKNLWTMISSKKTQRA